MGLFDFVRNIGKKLFDSDGEAAEKITADINADNPGISNLSCTYDDGKVVLCGSAATAEAAQKAVLMAGNVKGVSEVVSQLEIAGNAEATGSAALEPANVEYYIIQSGDSLSKIAKKYYQDANAYPKIFEANREVIKDADLIYPGQKIRIPLG